MLLMDSQDMLEIADVRSPLERKLDLNDENQFTRYNGAMPKVHNGGCNTGLLDGHVEWVSYGKLWRLDDQGEVTHRFWYPE